MEVKSSSQLSKLIEQNENVLIKFGAKWCGPCKRIKSVFVDLSEEYKKSCYFIEIDIDECRDVAEEYEIDSIPAFVLLHKGKKIEKYVGSDPHKLQRKIDHLLEL